MAEYKVSGGDLTNVADAIRTKGGTSASLSFPDGFVSAVAAIPTGGGSTLITKTITANGTYSAQDDDADGYSSVTVNVPAPSVPFVTGKFTGQASEKGSAITVNIPYTGSGYPIAGLIRPTGGAWVSDGPIASLAQKFAMIIFAFQKVDESTVPDYLSNNDDNKMDVVAYFKYSDTDAATTSTGKGHAQRNYYNSDASAAYATCVRLKSSTSMSVYIANTSYGFKDGVEYTYVIQYSE